MDRGPLQTFAALAILFAVPAIAQEPLTLEAALARASAQNEVPGIARARVERARALTREAWARVLPEAFIDGRYTRRPQDVARDGDVLQTRNGLGATATIRTRVIDAPAIPLLMGAARNEQAQQYESTALEQTLAYDVATTFYGVLSAEELVQAAERRVQVAQSALDVAKRRLEAGLVGLQDVTRTELSVSNARLARNEARVTLATSRLALGELLNQDLTGVALAPPGDELPPEPTGGVERRPDLLALADSVRAAELFAIEPWLRFVPSVDVGASYFVTNEPGFSRQTETWQLFATATWLLYDGGFRYAQARARSAEAEELRLTLSAQTRGALREAAEAQVRLTAAEEAVQEARTAQRIATANAEEVARLFAAGLATALERDDATVAAFEADSDLARKRFDLRLARLEQRRARGLWPLEEIE